MSEALVRDIKGKSVKLGTRIKLLKINEQIFEDLEKKDIDDLKSIVGKVYEFDDIDEYGQAWITKWWYYPEDMSRCHSITLRDNDFEVIN